MHLRNRETCKLLRKWSEENEEMNLLKVSVLKAVSKQPLSCWFALLSVSLKFATNLTRQVLLFFFFYVHSCMCVFLNFVCLCFCVCCRHGEIKFIYYSNLFRLDIRCCRWTLGALVEHVWRRHRHRLPCQWSADQACSSLHRTVQCVRRRACQHT